MDAGELSPKTWAAGGVLHRQGQFVSNRAQDSAGSERVAAPGATQVGRALRELAIALLAAHSPQAKGRVERSFQTAQDRLEKGLRVAGCDL